MLCPWYVPNSTHKAFFQLQGASHKLWPDFARNLQEATNIDIDFRTEGRLRIILDHEDVNSLRHEFEINRKLGLALEWLPGDEIRRREPHLTVAVTDGVFAPDYLVDNRQVALALKAAFQQAGGQLRERSEVKEIIIENGRATGVRLAGEEIAADTVILAAGSWVSQIAGSLSDQLPVRPVKGQMLALQMPPDEPLLRHMVTGPIYLIPRSDGRLLVGATVEEQDFNTQVIAGAIYDMLDRARQMLPAIDDLPIIESWAGLRPATADKLPIMGQTSVAGLFVSTGHFRHGILLAPITAQAMCNLILTRQVMDEIKPFSPKRFMKS
jgi:glycine oxidase